MIKQVRIEPEAEAELAETAAWYENRSAGLGTEFLRAFGAMLPMLEQNPEAYPIVYRSLRRAVMRRFPYNVIYRIDGDTVLVIACIHGKRHPRRWKRRI